MELLLLCALAGLVYLFVQGRRERTTPSRLRERPERTLSGSPQESQAGRAEHPRSSQTTRNLTVRVSVGDLTQERVPEACADDCWAPPGRPATIQDWVIPRGMVYAGRGLRDGRGWRTERALLDPSLTTRRGPTDPLSYYPSYAELSPAQRGRYLDWLAAGADGPDVGIGYVFLYFYGLERRVFLDGAVGEERAAVVAEVRRLYDLYRSNGSFERYAAAFLSAAEGAGAETAQYLTTPEIARRWEPDLRLRLALGQAAVDGAPIPADWALLWLYQDPYTSLRTAATRCLEELRALFRHRYSEQFGDGLRVKPNKTPLRVDYRASSGDFQAAVPVGDLPDVTALKRPLNQLRPVLDACTDELDAYSRFVGRHPEKRQTREAVGLLPPSLARERLADLDDPFLAWARDGVDAGEPVVVNGADLIERWGLTDARLTKAGALRKRDAESLAGVLDLLGVGIEPDVRRGGRKPQKGQAIVLFRLDGEEAAEASEAYRAAETVLTLVAAVAHADDEVSDAERRQAVAHVRDGLELSSAEAARLSARLAYLLHGPPSIHRIEEAAAALPARSKRTAADLALLTAVADGHLAPAESRVLKKVYSVLGLDPDDMYRDLHALQREASEPPVVRRVESGTRGYGLPRPPEEQGEVPATRGTAFELDMDLVRAKLADTQKASALLAGVFAAEDELLPEVEPEPSASAATWPGLDEDHAALLTVLVEREEWPRDRVEAAAAERGLMAGGALETLNEWAFEHLDGALIEDGDPVVVYLDVWTDYLTDA